MRIVVTGGAGFLGSHLCEELLARGHEVTCVDDFSTGQRSNIAHLERRTSFRVVEHDICTPYSCDCDQLYNLACPGSPLHYQREPIKAAMASSVGVLNVLEAARLRGARILQASTSCVYGEPHRLPQSESSGGYVNQLGYKACYEEGKRNAETLFSVFQRVHRLPVRIARIFNSYGPRMRSDDGRVVSNFVTSALHGSPLTIHGDGSQTRSFCYVDDTVRGLIALMECGDDEIGPVNIGYPLETAVLELATLVGRVVGTRISLRHLPAVADDPHRRLPDIGLARERLGWEPAIGLEEGLLRTIEYFKSS